VSVTVPPNTASCAEPAAGISSIVQTTINDLTMRDFIRTSSDHGFWTARDEVVRDRLREKY
jgi:hypothetical protein